MAVPAKRLLKEWKQLTKGLNSDPNSTSAGDKGTMADVLDLRPSDGTGNNLLEWCALLRGPLTGNYAGGVFEVSISVPPAYPQKPPKMSFRTRIWHPNVSWKVCTICSTFLPSVASNPLYCFIASWLTVTECPLCYTGISDR